MKTKQVRGRHLTEHVPEQGRGGDDGIRCTGVDPGLMQNIVHFCTNKKVIVHRYKKTQLVVKIVKACAFSYLLLFSQSSEKQGHLLRVKERDASI